MKDIRDISLFKRIMFLIFSIIIIAGIVIVVADIKFDVGEASSWFNLKTIGFAVICLCLLMSLIFLRLNKKSILLTISLIAYVIAGYFYTFPPFEEAVRNNDAILYCLCAFQAVILIYTISLDKNLGLKIFDIALRVALSLLAYFLLPQYLPDYFSSLQNTIFVIYMINALISFVSLFFQFKRNFLTCTGLLLCLAGSIFYAFQFGALALFGINGGFADFVNSFDMGFLLTAVGLYLISTDATFASNFVHNYVE